MFRSNNNQNKIIGLPTLFASFRFNSLDMASFNFILNESGVILVTLDISTKINIILFKKVYK